MYCHCNFIIVPMAIEIVAFPKQFQVFFITQRLAVEPVGRAEGDEAGHSRPAATARG